MDKRNVAMFFAQNPSILKFAGYTRKQVIFGTRRGTEVAMISPEGKSINIVL